MNLHLLDAGGAGLVYFAYGIVVLFLVIVSLAEGLIMTLMKYNKGKKAMLDSLIINLVSVAFGFVLMGSGSSWFELKTITDFLILYAITLALEFLVLWLLNKTKPITKTLIVSVVINLVSYGILFLFVYASQ